MDFIYLFKVLLRRIWILILVPLVAGAATYFLTQRAPKMYRSTAQLSTGITIQNSVELDESRFNIREANVQFNNLLQTLESSLVVSLVSYHLAIHDLKEEVPFRVPRNENGKVITFSEPDRNRIINAYQAKLESMELLSNFDAEEKKLIQLLGHFGYNHWQIESQLNVTRIKDTDYVKVQYLSEKPELSAFVVNTLCQEFIRYNKQLKDDRSGQSVEYFTKLVNEKKKTLEEANSQLAAYKQSNNLQNYSVESEVNISRIKELETAKQQHESEVRTYSLSLSNVQRRLSDMASDDGSGSGGNSARIVALRQRIRMLNEQYLETQNEALQDSLNRLRFELRSEIAAAGTAGTGTGATRVELEEKANELETLLQIARTNLSSVNAELANLRSNVNTVASKSSTITELEKAQEIAFNEYIAAQDKLNEAKSVTLINDSAIRQVIQGQPNFYPVQNKSLLFTALSMIVSFSLCVFVIVVMEFLDVRIKIPANFKRMTGLKLAGYLNDIRSDELDLNRIFHQNEKDQELKLLKDQVRKLRFEVENSDARVILITSTREQQGKSFLLLCLAYSLSLIQKKVLIIDTNFKNNTLTQMLLAKPLFNKYLKEGKVKGGRLLLSARSSASEEYTEEEEEEDFTRRIISPTGYKNIDIIGSTPGSESPSEIFSGRDFRSMLVNLANSYDYILLEGAALNDFSDTKELVGYVDKIIPVFSANATVKQVDKDSIAFLKEQEGRLMSAVLNMVESKNLKM